MNSHLNLTPEEYSVLEPILEKMSQESRQKMTLNKLFEDWSKFVTSVEKGYDDSIYEYTNDLSIRNIIQRVLDACPENAYTKLLRELEPLDNRLRSATREIDKPLLPDQNWWWHRIPLELTNDLREDLISEGFLS
jgi:hypothetical protein